MLSDIKEEHDVLAITKVADLLLKHQDVGEAGEDSLRTHIDTQDAHYHKPHLVRRVFNSLQHSIEHKVEQHADHVHKVANKRVLIASEPFSRLFKFLFGLLIVPGEACLNEICRKDEQEGEGERAELLILFPVFVF